MNIEVQAVIFDIDDELQMGKNIRMEHHRK
jgi:hypothetical protein